MKNINVENKARYTAIYFSGDEVGAIYVGVKNTEGKPFNIVLFRKFIYFMLISHGSMFPTENTFIP